MQIRRQLTPKMQPSAISVLLPEYRRRVLGLLLLHPDDALHGREIARRAGLPAGTVTRELVKLADAGLLQRERRGNQQIYSANKAHPIFAELASILRKTSGLADVLIDALAPVADQLRAAFVFGSVARGEETAGSDIDLMLIGELDFARAVQLLHPAQAQLGREINPTLYTPADLRKRIAAGNSFITRVLAQPRIWLIGSEHDLAA